MANELILFTLANKNAIKHRILRLQKNVLLLGQLWRICVGLFILLIFFAKVNAQAPASSNLRQKLLPVQADSIVLDTLSIIPNSLRIAQHDTASYRVDYVNAILYWKQRPVNEMVTIEYRVFPYKLNPVAQRMNYDSLVRFSGTPFVYNINDDMTDAQRGIFNFGNIQASGSFGRQIGFGNNQDAVLNSTLNVQLSGMLGDSIELQAAITDNNIPIQPDGNTQQLNEFDEVYIRFKKKNWQLNIGDIDIRQNQAYFLNFYKRLQGVSFNTTNRVTDKIQSSTLASASIAKGKFTRNVFDGLEGNQGPYRLQGANNEIFFIVLGNTERVYLDGELLQRGEDQDYVINYNTAEVTFTPKRMITKDSRIQIEFEYADRNFLNANVFLTQEFDLNKKAKVRFGFFNNNDAKNSSINQVLDAPQKHFLSQLGDSIQKAFYSSAALDTFSAGKILYEKIYVGTDSFYRYSTDPNLAKYSLGFIEVGFGNGNYVPDYNGANGKVYVYVEPVGGVNQGNYEPAVLLITPKKQQVFDLGVDYSFNENTILKVEGAMSNYDINTFSKLDKGNNNGFAGKVQFANKAKLSAKRGTFLQTNIDYEYVQDRFKPLERLRSVEFTRDWGLPIVTTVATENIIRFSGGLLNKNNEGITYKFTNYNRSDSYNGYQNSLLHKANYGGWVFNNDFTITNFSSATDKGHFLRPVLDVSKQFKKLKDWRVGGRYTLEQNITRSKETDTLSANAFSFDTYTVYVKSDEKKKNRYGINFFTRSDKYKMPGIQDLVRGDRSYNVNVQTDLLANEKRQLYVNATYRKLKVYEQTLSRQTADESILGRVEYMMNEWKGFVTGNALYEVGAGQEQRRDFAYLEVPAGQGQYAWIDYNENGQQELNEFELAMYPDQAKFIRLFTPTNDFIKANYTTFNYNIAINPRSLWGGNDIKGFKKVLAKFNLNSSLQITNKTVAKGTFQANPFKLNVNDTGLITLNTAIVNTLSFNRFSHVWGLDLSNINNSGKALLTYGYESRKTNDWTSKFRWNMSKLFLFNLNVRTARNELYTANAQFDNRNYDLHIYSAEPGLSFINGTTFRVAGLYKLESKKNKPVFGNESSLSHSLTAESKYNLLQNTAVLGKFTFQNIDYKQGTNNLLSPVSYMILEGLLPGKNYIWNITITKRLLNNLELNFQYDGRKSADSRTIHSGRATVTAIL